MKLRTTRPTPTHEIELEPEEVEEAILAYLKREVKRTRLPDGARLPKSTKDFTATLRIHGSQSNDDHDVGPSTSLLVTW